MDANNFNSTDKICGEFAQQNREYSKMSNSDNSTSKLKPNCHNFSTINETTHNSNSPFDSNRPTNQSSKHSSNFERIAQSFQSVLMMSSSHEETLSQIRRTMPSKVRSADKVGPSMAPPALVTPSTPGTDHTNVTNTPSSDCLYTDSLNFAHSSIFLSTLIASLTSKDAILKEMRDCINFGNEDHSRQISPGKTYI